MRLLQLPFSWNMELTQAWEKKYMGKISQEMGAEGWYVPGMNTHRTDEMLEQETMNTFQKMEFFAGNMEMAVEGESSGVYFAKGELYQQRFNIYDIFIRKYGESYIKHFAL